MTIALQTFDLYKSFGGITATDHVDFTLQRGARHALIGPNGAGKTTFVNQLTGVLKPSSGRIALLGEDITKLPRETRVRRGLARTFQINQLFATMTPLEMIALVTSERLGRGARPFHALDRDPELIAETAEILARFRLDDIMDQRIATLPYGKQRQIEIAAAFAAKPSVLLLDEPAAGERDPSAAAAGDADDAVDQCRLADTVAPEQSERASLGEREVDVEQHERLAIAGAQLLDPEQIGLQHVRHGRPRRDKLPGRRDHVPPRQVYLPPTRGR